LQVDSGQAREDGGREEAMGKERQSTLKGRDARTGQFIPVEEARQRPNTTVVERVPLPGKGTSGKK
jgi:hypothetical protein